LALPVQPVQPVLPEAALRVARPGGAGGGTAAVRVVAELAVEQEAVEPKIPLVIRKYKTPYFVLST